MLSSQQPSHKNGAKVIQYTALNIEGAIGLSDMQLLLVQWSRYTSNSNEGVIGIVMKQLKVFTVNCCSTKLWIISLAGQ